MNSVTAELNAKITAKHNTKMKGVLHGKSSNVYYNNHKSERHEIKFTNKSAIEKKHIEMLTTLTPPIDHDVEDRLTASKISISAFKNSNNNVSNMVQQSLLHPVHMQRINSSVNENALQRH